jgi:hypothetical protein
MSLRRECLVRLAPYDSMRVVLGTGPAELLPRVGDSTSRWISNYLEPDLGL